MRVVQGLAMGAALLGTAAAFAGSPFMSARSHINVDQLTQAIARGEDRVSPLQLAAWIRARKPGLRVIDVRSRQAFAEYAIPTAENIPLAELPHASFTDGQTVALYDDDNASGAQAWMMLRAMGHTNAVFISGGMVSWDTDVMNPTLPADAPPETIAAFSATADLSRYFGGEPRNAPAGAASSQPGMSAAPPRPVEMRRRGC